MLVTLTPLAAAGHGDAPPPPGREVEPPCQALPVWDYAMCTLDRSGRWTQWALDFISWTDVLVRCDVIGGPVCDFNLEDFRRDLQRCLRDGSCVSATA